MNIDRDLVAAMREACASEVERLAADEYQADLATAIRALPLPASDGLVCVPVEPDDVMIRAAMHGRDGTLPAAVIRSVWSAMLTAATQEPNQ